MAFTKKELEIINWGKENGRTNDEILRAVTNAREKDKNQKVYKRMNQETTPLLSRAAQALPPTISPLTSKRFINKETMEDVKNAPGDIYKSIKEPAEERRTLSEEMIDEGSPEAFTKMTQAPWAMLEGAMGGVGGAMISGGKILLSQEAEDTFKQKAGEAGAKVMANKTVSSINSELEELRKNDPSTYSSVKSMFSFGELALDVGTLGLGSKYLNVAKKVLKDRAAKYADGVPVKPLISSEEAAGRNADDIIETAIRKREELDTTQGVRAAAEAEAPGLTFREKWIGLREDQKKRLLGNEELLKDYINITQSRNKGDFIFNEKGNKIPLPSPLGYGAKRAETAAELLKAKLDDTGSFIGKTREKLASTQADMEALEAMESSFNYELSKLNLTVKDGRIVPQQGRNALTQAEGDITALQRLYEQMQVVKQAPNLQNYNEFRSILDSNINYAKSVGEASNSLDPLSRGMRTTMRDETSRLLGSEYADALDEYSAFMDAYKELSGYTNRRAGGEYLMRLLDSGRSREADELIKTIADYTNIDLKDDASIISLTTDMFGNASQKTTFQQELMKLGVDVTGAAAGSPTSWLSLAGQGITRALIDEEKWLIRASKGQKGMPLSQEAKVGGAVMAGGAAYYASDDPTVGGIVMVSSAIPAGGTARREALQAIAKVIPEGQMAKLNKFVDLDNKGAFGSFIKSEGEATTGGRVRQFNDIDGMSADEVEDIFNSTMEAFENIDITNNATKAEMVNLIKDLNKQKSFSEGAIPQTTLDDFLEGWTTIDIATERAPQFSSKQIAEFEKLDLPKGIEEPTIMYRAGDTNEGQLSSWTVNREAAEFHAEVRRDAGLDDTIQERTVDPDEVLVSLTDLSPDLKKKYNVIEEEEEFILKPLK